jgi:monovalent cation:H+ antiporter-2, CPA2 family
MHAQVPLLSDIAIVFAVAVAAALVLARFRVPVVLAYIGTGLLLGSAGLGLVEHTHALDVLAEVGVALLLFTLGLEFSLGQLRKSWRTVALAGSAQVTITVGAVAVVTWWLGEGWSEATTWGFLVALSSTAVVLRMLDVRGETHAAHGRFVVGVLVFQDLAVVAMLLLLPILGGEKAGVGHVATTLLKSCVIIVAILGGARFVVPPLLAAIARTRNREVFLLSVLAIAGMTAFATSMGGLSIALGAFLAGMVLADTQYSHQAMSDVFPLRSAMMCLFFVTIGLLIEPSVIARHPAQIVGIVTAVVVGKFLLVFLVGLALRFPPAVAALAAAALAQVGEFSFVLAGAAVDNGLLDSEEHETFLAASVLTIVVAPVILALTPRVLAGTRVLAPLERLLGPGVPEAATQPVQISDHVVVTGFGVGGRTVVDALDRCGVPMVIIELNPDTVRAEQARGRNVVYGDSTSAEILDHAGLARARALVIVVSDPRAAQETAAVARRLRPDLQVFLRTRWASDEGGLRESGAVVVSEEYAGAAAMATEVLKTCGHRGAHEVLDEMAEEHAQLPPGVEADPEPPGEP